MYSKYYTGFFIVSFIAFFYFKTSFNLSYWFLVILINIFLFIHYLGASQIALNFHLRSVCKLPVKSRTVMLTFDDGPHNPCTTEVLKVLRKHQVKALFFVIGKNIPGNETIMKQLVEDGHLLGNHSFSHHTLFDFWLSPKVKADLKLCQQLLEQYQTGRNLFRPPYGVTNTAIARSVKKLKLQSVGWSIRSFDTKIKDVEKIKRRILAQLKPGSIILLHDRLSFMPELLETLIPAIREKGYDFSIQLD